MATVPGGFPVASGPERHPHPPTGDSPSTETRIPGRTTGPDNRHSRWPTETGPAERRTSLSKTPEVRRVGRSARAVRIDQGRRNSSTPLQAQEWAERNTQFRDFFHTLFGPRNPAPAPGFVGLNRRSVRRVAGEDDVPLPGGGITPAFAAYSRVSIGSPLNCSLSEVIDNPAMPDRSSSSLGCSVRCRLLPFHHHPSAGATDHR